jgi:V8-like Glu-specific endopeptidase
MSDLVADWYKRRQHGADLDVLQPLTRLKATGRGFETVHGNDDRVVVADVTAAPWRPLVCLELHAGTRVGVGTGLLIAPDVVLTAAHNLYLLETGSFLSAIVATVGVKNGTGATEARVAHVDVCPGYTSLGGPKDPRRFTFDFGIARLGSDALYKWAGSAVNVMSQTPLSDADLVKSKLTVAGYPYERTQPLALKSCFGPVLPATVGPVNFGYEMDSTAGQSGGPVFRYSAETKAITFAGVHVAGDSDDNIARRYDASMQQQLRAWMAMA